MALSFTNLLAINQTASNPLVTASVTVPEGAAILVSLGTSQTAPNTAGTATISGPAGLTFFSLGRPFVNPRALHVWIGINGGAETSGALTLTYVPDGGGTMTGQAATVDLVEGILSGDEYETPVTNTGSTAALTLPDVGTLAEGSGIFIAGLTSNPAAGVTNMSIDAPAMVLGAPFGANVRQIISGYDTSVTPDETPTITAGASAAMMGLAVIINAAPEVYTGEFTEALMVELQGIVEAGASVFTVAYNPATVIGDPEADAEANGGEPFWREDTAQLVQVIYTKP